MANKIIGMILMILLFIGVAGSGLASVGAHGDEDISNPDHHGGMMSGFYSGFGFMWMFGWLFMVLVLIVLILFVVWLVKQLPYSNKPKKRKRR